MKRDIDLQRAILLRLEEDERAPMSFDGRDEDDVGYQVFQLWKANLIQAADSTAMDSKCSTAIPIGLLPAGHDMLDKLRDETLWKRAVTALKSTGGTLTLEAAKAWVIAAAGGSS